MGALAAMPFENLPLGFRFKPTDVELIDHYLRLKINGKEDVVACIKEVDICRVEPWDLPDLSAIKTNDHEWFFFCPRDRKYPNGQRSNRATEAGYWKATGKDRTIKSRKLGLIGMKKTLVFYTGRAPKGQRTNWVIHEYRPTLQELDGSHPGQGAFVLCRLFKKADDVKPDDNDDGSHIDEVETNFGSPNPTNITQEDIRSEPAVVQASPLSVDQSVEQQMNSENCVVKTSDSMTSETMFPDRPQVIEEMTPEVDSHAYEPIFFYDPPEPYYKWQTMQVNQGPVGLEDIFSTDIGDGHNGLHLQDVNGGDAISDFLDSVIINPDAYSCKEAGRQRAPTVQSNTWKTSIKESGSCSGSDVEITQQQHDVGYICCITSDETMGNKELQNNALADDDDIFSDAALDRFCNLSGMSTGMVEPLYYGNPALHTGLVKAEDGSQIIGNNGIKIRSHMRGRQLQSSNFAGQGTAPRRIRLQVYEDEEKYVKPTVTEGSGSADLNSSSVNAPYEDFICLEDLCENAVPHDESKSSENTSEVAESGINIRTHLQRSRPSASRSVEQGTARRRIRLQKASAFDAVADEDKTLVAEIRNLPEEVCEKQHVENSAGALNKKPISFQRATLAHMVKVVMVVFLFMACVGLYIARSVLLFAS